MDHSETWMPEPAGVSLTTHPKTVSSLPRLGSSTLTPPALDSHGSGAKIKAQRSPPQDPGSDGGAGTSSVIQDPSFLPPVGSSNAALCPGCVLRSVCSFCSFLVPRMDSLGWFSGPWFSGGPGERLH